MARVHAGARHRHRAVHAGADDHRAEHGRLPRPRRGHLRGDVLPDAGQLVRRGGLRHGLRQRPAATRCPPRWPRSPGVDPAAIGTPEGAARATRPSRSRRSSTRTRTRIHVVFLSAVPVAGVAFVLSLFLKEVPLRGTARAGAGDVGDGFGMPEGATARSSCRSPSPGCCAPAAARRWPRSGTRPGRAGRRPTAGAWARSTSAPGSAGTPAWPRSRTATGCRSAVLQPAFEQARAAGYLAGDDDHLRLTGAGRREIDGLIAAMQAWLSRRAAGLGRRGRRAAARGDGQYRPADRRAGSVPGQRHRS